MKLHCGICSVPIENKDFVYLTELNTVIHQRCYEPVKDSGTFQEFKDKYDFFNDL